VIVFGGLKQAARAFVDLCCQPLLLLLPAQAPADLSLIIPVGDHPLPTTQFTRCLEIWESVLLALAALMSTVDASCLTLSWSGCCSVCYHWVC